jgi:hypothetical protein
MTGGERRFRSGLTRPSIWGRTKRNSPWHYDQAWPLVHATRPSGWRGVHRGGRGREFEAVRRGGDPSHNAGGARFRADLIYLYPRHDTALRIQIALHQTEPGKAAGDPARRYLSPRGRG